MKFLYKFLSNFNFYNFFETRFKRVLKLVILKLILILKIPKILIVMIPNLLDKVINKK